MRKSWGRVRVYDVHKLWEKLGSSAQAVTKTFGLSIIHRFVLKIQPGFTCTYTQAIAVFHKGGRLFIPNFHSFNEANYEV